MIFVAVDDAGNPIEVPPWTPVTMLELQQQRQARIRIRMRQRIEAAMETETYTAEGTAPRTVMRFRAAATDVNSDGKVRGGRVMRWIDETAYASGADWTGHEVVTSYLAGIRFHHPVFVGEVAEVTARTIHTGSRSIHTSVDVTIADTVGGAPRLVARALVVVVSLDERGQARPVPQWQPLSGEDHRLDQHARHLTELRQLIEPFTTATAVTDAEPTRSHDSAIAH